MVLEVLAPPSSTYVAQEPLWGQEMGTQAGTEVGTETSTAPSAMQGVSAQGDPCEPEGQENPEPP